MTEALHHIIYTARRFKASTALNITGLIVAFAICYLLLTQIVFLTTYNQGIKDHERIYRLERIDITSQNNKWGSGSCMLMAEELAAMPQVEGVTMTSIAWLPYKYKFKQGDTEVDFPAIYCNNSGVSNLTDQVVDGNIEWTDTDRDGLIIPASIAMQYFGTTHAAGQQMLAFINDSTYPIPVRGVYKDFPENSTPQNYIMINAGDAETDSYDYLHYGFTCLVKFKEGVNDVNSIIEPFKQRLEASSLRIFGDDIDPSWMQHLQTLKFQFRPLDDVFFSNIDELDLGNRNALGIIKLLTILILLITTINFLNFTLAMSPMWVHDINTRMVIGAKRSSIRWQLIAETVIISASACMLALALCQGFSMSPALNKLFDGDITLNAHPGIIITMLVIAVAIGFIAGTYPAYFATSFQAATVLKRNYSLTPGSIKLRTALIGMQLIVTIFLASFICTLYQQTIFIFTSDYGFDFERIVHVDLDMQDMDYREALRADLKQLPGVENVAYSQFCIGSSDDYPSQWYTNSAKDSTIIHYFLFPVDECFLSTMGIELVTGRELEPNDEANECIFNETMNELFSSEEMPLSKVPNPEMDIVGVCKNIRFATTRINKNTPIAFVRYANDYLCWIANVRIAEGTDMESTKASIAQLIKKHSGHESPQVMDMETTLKQSYSNEFRFVNLVYLLSVASIIIMLVGVFCLTMLETEYRRKEIGIRKVAGASSGDIIGMLCKRYCGLILVCFVIATPIAYYLGNLWLKSFAEHQPINWWQFPFSLLVVGGLTLGTILLQCWHVAHENPVNSIKDE